MKAIVSLSNRIQLEVDDRDEMETLHKAIVLSNPPSKCTLCNGVNLSYDSNKDKEGNVYVNIKCACGAKAKLGRYKTGGFFWHGTFEKYVKSTIQPPPPVATSQPAPAADEFSDESPF